GVDAREQFLERRDLLPHRVAAVVDQDVDLRDALRELAQEAAILLVADVDLHAVLFELLAVRIDVDAMDGGAGAEVILPHAHRAALRHAELDDMRGLAAETGEVAVVDFEVVPPLVDQSIGVGFEETLEVV